MNVKIVVDSTADLRPELTKKVSVVPLSVHFGQKTYISGVDINPSSYSKLEGQRRMASDIEVQAIARILDVPVEVLFAE